MGEPEPRTRRLFVGIELDAEARHRCAAVSDELRKTGFPRSTKRPKSCTSRSLSWKRGILARRRRRRGIRRTIATGLRPCDVMLDKLGAFPHERKPRVVYIGAREQGAAFRALAQRVRSAYAALGFPFDERCCRARNDRAQSKIQNVRCRSSSSRRSGSRFERVTLFESLFDNNAKHLALRDRRNSESLLKASSDARCAAVYDLRRTSAG